MAQARQNDRTSSVPKALGAAALLAALLARPTEAAQGARLALAQWAQGVAPALFPFMALMPLLTGALADRPCRGPLGRAFEALFGLPGAAAPALAAGLAAGSPAGALAARRAAAQTGMPRGRLWQLALGMGGLSPAFLIGGVGAGLLGSPRLGVRLALAQSAAQLTLLALLRRAWRGESQSVPPLPPDQALPPVRAAVQAVLTVGGYMALFAALARAIGALLDPRAGAALLCLMDVPSGAGLLAALSLPMEQRLVLLSALCGFGGLGIGAQNLAALGPDAPPPRVFWSVRLLSAALCALFTALQSALLRIARPLLTHLTPVPSAAPALSTGLSHPAAPTGPLLAAVRALACQPLRLSALAAAGLAMIALRRIGKNTGQIA